LFSGGFGGFFKWEKLGGFPSSVDSSTLARLLFDTEKVSSFKYIEMPKGGVERVEGRRRRDPYALHTESNEFIT
jgi:hypothetical protein